MGEIGIINKAILVTPQEASVPPGELLLWQPSLHPWDHCCLDRGRDESSDAAKAWSLPGFDAMNVAWVVTALSNFIALLLSTIWAAGT